MSTIGVSDLSWITCLLMSVGCSIRDASSWLEIEAYDPKRFLWRKHLPRLSRAAAVSFVPAFRRFGEHTFSVEES